MEIKGAFRKGVGIRLVDVFQPDGTKKLVPMEGECLIFEPDEEMGLKDGDTFTLTIDFRG